MENTDSQFRSTLNSVIPSSPLRWLMFFFGISGLFVVYLLQDFSYADAIVGPLEDRWTAFIWNKIFRFMFNDVFTLCVIFSLFFERKYMLFAIYVQLFGLLVLLPTYLGIKFYWGDTYRNLDANLHRVVMNPVLLMLLIPAFFIQKQSKSSQ